jgi:hypothetical protein
VLQLRLLKKRDLPEPLDVGLAFEINHDANRSCAIDECKRL